MIQKTSRIAGNRPARGTNGDEASGATRPKFAYFPFGGGPRVCIGEGFAWMEGVLILATLAQRWRMELLTPDVGAQASITLRPRGGIAVRLHARV